MALATTVTGTGKIIHAQREGDGNFNYFTESGGTVTQHTVTYVDVRVTRKWYGLTLAACMEYVTANQDANTYYDLTNEALNSYELVTESVEREIVQHSTSEVSEPA